MNLYWKFNKDNFRRHTVYREHEITLIPPWGRDYGMWEVHVKGKLIDRRFATGTYSLHAATVFVDKNIDLEFSKHEEE